MSEEPAYRTAYEKDGTLTCPETGTDLSEFSADGIRAHAEYLFQGDPRNFGSEAAKKRKALLLKMADEKESK